MSSHAADSKKRRILESARRLLVERGFQDIVLDDVARAAGVAKGTLFLYFKSKDEMLSGVFADLVERLGGELEALLSSGKKGQGLLEETVRVILVHCDRNHDFMSQFGLGRFPGCGKRSCDRLMGLFRRNVSLVARILRKSSKAARAGRVGSRADAACVLFGLCRSAWLMRVLSGDSRPLSGRAPQVVDMFMHGVGGRR